MVSMRKQVATLVAFLVLVGIFWSSIPEVVGAWVATVLMQRAHDRWETEVDMAKESERSGNLELAEEHLLASYRMATDRTIPPNADSCLSAYGLGTFYRRHSDNKRALEFFDIAQRECGVVFGRKSVEAAKTLRRFIDVLHDLGFHAKELRYAKCELDIRETIGAKAPDLVRSLRSVGRAQREAGDYSAALHSLERAEALQQGVVKTTGEHEQAKLDLAMIQGTCGVVAYGAGKYRQAKRWFELAIPALKSARSVPPEAIDNLERVQLRTIDMLNQ